MNRNHRKWLRSPSERVGTLAHSDLPPPVDGDDQHPLVEALRAGDEVAFTSLLDRLHASMLRVARTYVRSPEDAEEVVQDTWLAVLRGIDRFENRSSLVTWIYRILVNRARSHGRRAARMVPFSSLRPDPGADSMGADAAPDRLLSYDRQDLPWHGRPSEHAGPMEAVLARELRARLDLAVGGLPDRQKEVIVMRDLRGHSATEVCGTMSISAENQRVLLHRARTGVRNALQAYLV